jgi:tryptophan synthase alpha chain
MGKEKIQRIFEKDKNILSLYLTAGYPKKDAMPKLAEIAHDLGVDFIEAGMPYSDPLADGETIQKSSEKALKNGMNLQIYFDQVKQIKKETSLPVIFMGYFNQVLQYGPEQFLNTCLSVGIDGLIIPDLPPEVYEIKYQKLFEKYNMAMIFLVSPTTSEERVKKIDKLSSGFVYVVSTSATTGKKNRFGEEQINYFKRIKKLLKNNRGIVGFGIDNREKFLLANRYLNGAIIGSAFIKVLSNEGDYKKQARSFIKSIIHS